LAERKSFLLRINPELYAVLDKWAADELRSVNGQIEFLLLEAVRKAARDQRMKKPEVRS
jgi:hypothetical protein